MATAAELAAQQHDAGAGCPPAKINHAPRSALSPGP
jgi:hypothetical protein